MVTVCWDSRDSWVAAVRMATGRGVWRRHLRAARIDPDTFARWAAAEAAYGDHRTGRDSRGLLADVAATVDVSPRTIQRCRALARQLGILHTVALGRSARALRRPHGETSTHHHVVPPALYPYVNRVRRQRAARRRVTPFSRTLSKSPGRSARGGSTSPHAVSARRRGPASRSRGVSSEHVGDRLARDWLTGPHRAVGLGLSRVGPRCIGPSLAAAERAGITARQITVLIDAEIAAGRLRLPTHRPRHGAWRIAVRLIRAVAGPLAVLIAQQTTTVRPPTYAAGMRSDAPECEHGAPGGAALLPTGMQRCPFCRLAARRAAARQALSPDRDVLLAADAARLGERHGHDESELDL